MQFAEPWNSVLKLKQTKVAFPDIVYLYRNMFIMFINVKVQRNLSGFEEAENCHWAVQHRIMFLVQVSEVPSTMIKITLKCQCVTPPFQSSHYKYTFFGSDMFGAVCTLSRLVVFDSATARLLCPWGFSRQGYRSGLPFSDTLNRSFIVFA